MFSMQQAQHGKKLLTCWKLGPAPLHCGSLQYLKLISNPIKHQNIIKSL